MDPWVSPEFRGVAGQGGAAPSGAACEAGCPEKGQDWVWRPDCAAVLLAG